MKKFILVFINTVLVFFNCLCFFSIAAAKEPMTLEVLSSFANTGENVQVTILLENNPGISSLLFNVSYDSVLTLQDVEFNSNFGSLITASKPYRNPQTISFISPFVDVEESGIFAVLTFKVSENIKNVYKAPIKVFYNKDNIFNESFEKIPINIDDGYVYINPGRCQKHYDFDRDGSCDGCGMIITQDSTCNCICHRTDVFGLIWRVFRIIFKAFNIRNTCYCGEVHY